MTRESWIEIGMGTGWLQKTAADVDSQLSSMLGQNIPAVPQTAQVNQAITAKYQTIASEKEWLDNFMQAISTINATVTANLQTIDRLPSKNQYVTTIQNQLRQIQGMITTLAQTLPDAQQYYMSAIQTLEQSMGQYFSTMKANQSGVYPSGTSNVPMGGAPAIPTI